MTEAEALANAKAACMWEYVERFVTYHRRLKTAQNASKTGQRVCEQALQPKRGGSKTKP